jgi:hypothetical protein
MTVRPMALPFPLAQAAGNGAAPQDLGLASHDPRALRILAKTIYRELRQSGLGEQDVIAVAGDLLGLVAGDVKDRRTAEALDSAR